MLAIRDQDWEYTYEQRTVFLVNMSLSVLTTQLYKLCVHITLKKIKKKVVLKQNKHKAESN